VNAAPYTVSGTVSGLTGTGLSLRMTYFSAGIGTPSQLTVDANAVAFAFPDQIPANGVYAIGILAQPQQQICTITRGFGSSTTDVTNVRVVCASDTASTLSGTYSLLDLEGRQYVNFNADGTFTTALIHNGSDCNTATDTRNGNGVEYGAFSWNQSTGVVQLGTAIDTNGACGLVDSTDSSRNIGVISRVGDTIVGRDSPGAQVAFTATAVESDPASLVGAFVPEANNGWLLVFHSDGTFLWAETQTQGLFPVGYGQERGCYTVSGGTVTLTIDSGCRPDGFAAYDLNGFGGQLPLGVTSITRGFTLNDPNTLTISGRVLKRTRPN
jgi:hypothetical protein